MKKSRKSQNLKIIILLLSDNYLYLVKEGDTQIKAQIPIILSKLEIITEFKSSVDLPNYKGFRLTRNRNQFEFFTQVEEQFIIWKTELTKRCFQSTFHEEFQGTFAKVYYAIKKDTGEHFAIKAFNKEYMKEQFKGKESLESELKILRELNHENIIKLYQVYETQNSLYFVMDLLEGGELLEKFKKKATMQYSDLQKIMYQLISTLAYIHSKQCVHRDLKPENILFRKKDSISEIIIADFGLAQFLNRKILFKRCGTPGYVAPEVLSYEDGQDFYTTSCDIYSIGTGKQPFLGSNYQTILMNNRKGEIDFNIPSINNLPKVMQDLLKRMLKKNPNERITAIQCLKHPFFQNLNQGEDLIFETSEDLHNYKKEFLSPLQKKYKFFDSIESVGSMQLQTRVPAMKGDTNTINSLNEMNITSYRNLEQTNQKPLQFSKFSQYSQKAEENQNQFQQSFASESPKNFLDQQSDSPKNNKVKQQNDLHKMVLKNTLIQKMQQEMTNEENCDIQEKILLLQSNYKSSPGNSPKNKQQN